MIPTWSDSDKSSSKEEIQSVANLCLMAQDDEVTSKLSLDFTFEELQDTFHYLMKEFGKVSLKNKDLKLKNESLSREKEEILQNNK